MTRARMAALVAAVVVAILAYVWTSDGGDDSGPAIDGQSRRERAEAWSREAAAAYTPLGNTALELPGRVRAWLDGTRPPEQLRLDLDEALAATTGVRDRLERLRPFPFHGSVTPLYRASAVLYVEHVHVYEHALSTAPGDGRTQLDLIARRTRVLADRIFDRGQALVEPYLDRQENADVIVNLPEEVPNWAAEGLAAGPPLAPPPPPAAGPPPLRQDTRPVQPRDTWEVARRDAGIPRPEDVGDAIAAHDAARLAALAQAFEVAAERLRAVPDPEGAGGREESARLRLGLLVRGEAARTAQAAIVVGAPTLREVASRVLEAAEPLG